MRIGDILLALETHKPVLPQRSLVKGSTYHSGRRPGVVESFVGVGALTPVGTNDDNIIATANALMMFLPNNKPGKEGRKLAHSSIYESLDAAYHVVVSNRPKEKPQMTLRRKINDKEIVVFPDASCLYVMTTQENMDNILSQLQYSVFSEDLVPSVTPYVVGMGVFDTEGPAAKLRTVPHDRIKFGMSEIEMHINAISFSMTQGRNMFRYVDILATAIRVLIETFDDLKASNDTNWNVKKSFDIKGNDEGEFYHALANYMLYSYGSTNQAPPGDLFYDASDFARNLLQYLGLPWSESYPFLQPIFNPDALYKDSPDRKVQTEVARAIKAIFNLNIALTMCLQRVGAVVSPVHYIRRKGSYFTIRKDLELFMKPAYDAGGSNDVWIPLAHNKADRNKVYLPMKVQVGVNEYGHNYSWQEKYDTVNIERAEMQADKTVGADVHRLLTVSRDARVSIVEMAENLGTTYVMARLPVTHHGNKEPGLGVFLSYLSDGTDKPGHMLPIDHKLFLSSKFDLVVGQYGEILNKNGTKHVMQGHDEKGNKTAADTYSVPGLPAPGTSAEQSPIPHNVIPKSEGKATLAEIAANQARDEGEQSSIPPAPDANGIGGEEHVPGDQ